MLKACREQKTKKSTDLQFSHFPSELTEKKTNPLQQQQISHQ